MEVIDVTKQLAVKRLKSRRRASDIRFIVVHHTATPQSTTPEQVHGWHLSRVYRLSDGTLVRGRGIGYHAYIRADVLQVYKTLPDLVVGAHARLQNTVSLGIAVSGNYEVRNPGRHF